MKLILIRHGQTEENKKHIWQGWFDSMLNQEGEKQAKKLANVLEKENISTIYCSDLQRARDTIKPFLKDKNIPVHYVKELRERSLGILECTTTEQREEYLKKNKVNIRASNLETGETSKEVEERISKLYKEVIDKYEDVTILFVTHGGPIAHLILYIFDHPPDKFSDFFPSNASITKIEIKKGKPKILTFNDTSHF